MFDLVLPRWYRARFCELIAPKLKQSQIRTLSEGLLSDGAILESALGVVDEELPLGGWDPVAKAQCFVERRRTHPVPPFISYGGRERRLG